MPTKEPVKKKRVRVLTDADKKRMRYYNIKRNFGLEPEEYEDTYARLFAEQGGRCAICRQEWREDRYMPLDHCHTTGKIRGLLCVRCNRGIGGFSDQFDLVQAAADYLKKYL